MITNAHNYRRLTDLKNLKSILQPLGKPSFKIGQPVWVLRAEPYSDVITQIKLVKSAEKPGQLVYGYLIGQGNTLYPENMLFDDWEAMYFAVVEEIKQLEKV